MTLLVIISPKVVIIIFIPISLIYSIWFFHAVSGNLQEPKSESEIHCWFCAEINRLSAIIFFPSTIIWHSIHWTLTKCGLIEKE